jgi:ferredoxin
LQASDGSRRHLDEKPAGSARSATRREVSDDEATLVARRADETLLTVLRRANVTTPYSCQQGLCGTYRTRVLDGEVDHRDTLLTIPEREGGMMLVCISRAAPGGRLTLGL